MKLITGYQPAKFQFPQLSELNSTRGFYTTPLKSHYDVTLQYLDFKIAHFVELNRSYQHAEFHWPRLCGSNFMDGWWKTPLPRLTRSQKAQSLKGKTF